MKSKLTLIGDPHAKPSNLDKIQTLFEIVEDLGNPCVWLGDMLDTKELVRGKCLNTLYEGFRESKLQHYVLVGNHDWFNLKCEDHSLRTLQSLDNVDVVQSPVITEYGLMVPYIHDHQEFKKVMVKRPWDEKRAFIHQGFSGFDYGNGFIAKEESDISWLKDYDLVVSGHFHKYQKQGNLTYLGTPFSHSFGESNQTKYIGVLDLETNEIKLLKSPFPKHLTVEINCEKVKKVKPDEENYLRYVLNGSQEAIDQFDRTGHPSGTKFVERPDLGSLDIVVDELESNEVKFKKWAEAQEMDPETIQMGLELLGGN